MVSLRLLGLLAASAPLASAHFQLEHPQWRANTLAANKPDRYSQWVYPCAGVLSNDTGVNRTEWPLDGGSLVLDLHHDFTYVFVNLGLQLTPGDGVTVTTFNYSLSGPTFWNVTSNGTLFVEKLRLPAGLAPVDGQKASIQIVTPTSTGNALYNCADIVFRQNAKTLSASDFPKALSASSYYEVASGPSPVNGTGTGTGGATTTVTATTTATVRGAAGAGAAVNGLVLMSVTGMAALFAYGMGW